MSPAAEVTRLPIGNIKVKENVRKHFDPKAHDELTQNVKKVGILQPLLVRKNGAPGVYELIAGERRLRAATAAGSKDVPVRVLECSDEEALEIQAFENLHRKDLGPIEEARAFKLLTSAKKDGEQAYDVKALAGRVDKSEAYVYRSLRLLDLPEAVLTMIEEGKLTPAHGHQLLRAPENRRAGIAKDAIRQRMHAGDLQEAIDRELGHDLAKTEFPKDRPYAGKPACIGCPLNSDHQVDLLGDVVKGRCTGADCFKTKTDAYVVQFQQEQKAKLPGVKFGPVVQRDHSIQSPPGMVQLPASPAVLALVKKDPAAFRAVVIKERDWNEHCPGLVILGRPSNEAKRAAGYPVTSGSRSSSGERAGERPSRMEAIGGLAVAAERRARWEKIGKLPTVAQLKEILHVNGDDDRVCEVLQITPDEFQKFDQTQLLKAAVFVYASFGGDLESIARGVREDFREPIEAAAAKVWPKHLSPACKVCGCTPNRGCTIGKKDDFRSCWWVKPGLCSACQAQGKDIPAAAEKSKGKKKA